jgi:hypothetical protein
MVLKSYSQRCSHGLEELLFSECNQGLEDGSKGLFLGCSQGLKKVLKVIPRDVVRF